MLIHRDKNFTIFFGDQTISFTPREFYEMHTSEQLLAQSQFSQLKHNGAHSLLTLRQTHSVTGYSLPTESEVQNFLPYMYEGDYLITSVKNVGLGISTADCLPIILYDIQNNIIAAIHAGWRGTVNGITAAAVQHMQRDYGTPPEHLQVFFGPAAGVCCYEVAPNFGEQIQDDSLRARTLVVREGKQYFDNTLYNQLVLEEFGVALEAINKQHNFCTMEKQMFCSYRRDCAQSRRQMTIVMLGL